MNYPPILSAPWAIQPAALEELLARYKTQSPINAASPMHPTVKRPEYGFQNGVAIVSIDGVLMRRPGLFDLLFGAQSTEEIAIDLAGAIEDAGVKGIVLEVNSPGGSVDGTQELANAVLAAARRKPVVALANGLMCSAAYWIGAAAKSVWISSETSVVGSIGVLATHYDFSERERMLGVKVSEVYAGRYKAAGSSHAPLSEEGRETLQAQVDYLYTVFVNDIARMRGVPAATVLERMADGRIFIGQQAIAAGLVDGQASLAELTGRLGGSAAQTTFAHAGPGSIPAAQLSLEQQCKAQWDGDAKVRSEFGGQFSAYLAWKRLVAEGRAHGGRNRNGN